MIDLGKDIPSLSEFKRKTSGFLSQMRDSGQPLVLTVNGKAELVVQDAVSYQRMLDRVEELETLAGIRQGLADVADGRVVSLGNFEKEFRAKRGLPGPARRRRSG